MSRQAENVVSTRNMPVRLCIADALDNCAAALRQVAIFLPPRLRNLPGVVAAAARNVRVSRSKEEAVQALRVAVAAVHKDIALLKADDPIARGRNARGRAGR